MEDAGNDREQQRDAVQRERTLHLVRFVLKVDEQPAHHPSGQAHAHLLAKRYATERHAGYASAALDFAVIHSLRNDGPEHWPLQVNDEVDEKIQNKSGRNVAGLHRQIHDHAQREGDQL